MTLGKLKPYFFKYHKLMHFCTGSTILCFSLKFIYIFYSILKLCNIHTRKTLTLFQRGGDVPGNPLTYFGYNSRSIGLRLFKFFTFLTNTYPLFYGGRRGFYTYCLSPLAYCLNALFYLYPAKSIFKPTYSHCN